MSDESQISASEIKQHGCYRNVAICNMQIAIWDIIPRCINIRAGALIQCKKAIRISAIHFVRISTLQGSNASLFCLSWEDTIRSLARVYLCTLSYQQFFVTIFLFTFQRNFLRVWRKAERKETRTSSKTKNNSIFYRREVFCESFKHRLSAFVFMS